MRSVTPRGWESGCNTPPHASLGKYLSGTLHSITLGLAILVLWLLVDQPK